MTKIEYFFANHCSIEPNSTANLGRVDSIWNHLYKRKDMKGPIAINGVMRCLEKMGIKIRFGTVYGIKLNGQEQEEEIVSRKKRSTFDPEKYQRYLTSRAWWVKREAVMKRCGGICERCRKNRATAVHHESYIRIYEELLTDLKALCTGCHRFLHAKADYDPLKGK